MEIDEVFYLEKDADDESKVSIKLQNAPTSRNVRRFGLGKTMLDFVGEIFDPRNSMAQGKNFNEIESFWISIFFVKLNSFWTIFFSGPHVKFLNLKLICFFLNNPCYRKIATFQSRKSLLKKLIFKNFCIGI
jgi:hypothetical protein